MGYTNTAPYMKKRGRPPGRLNTPKEGTQAASMADKVKKLFELVDHMLTPRQREYYKRAFSGKEEFDPLKHSEFFLLLLSVYTNDLVADAITGKEVSQDIAQTIREFRMGLKELNDMQMKRNEMERKQDDEGRMVDPTRQPTTDILDDILAGTI